MRRIFPLLLLWIPIATCQYDIGDPCPDDADQPTGVCTLYENCAMARIMVDIQMVKPTYCSIEGSVKIVCCPNTFGTTTTTTEMTTEPIVTPSPEPNPNTGNETDDDSPVEMNFLEALKAGIYRSNGKVCRFDGSYPITCYNQEYPTYIIDPERDPKTCPKLPQLKIKREMDLSPHLQVAVEACRNYSLEGSLCIPANISGHYVRDDCLTQDIFTKVADGEPAEITQFPHMTVLGVSDPTQIKKKNKNIIWFGGGSLISEYFILTAGHVILYETSEVEYAMLGATNKTDLQSGVIFQVVQTITYKDYNIALKYHDIALLELNRRVSFSEYIRPLCLRVTGLPISQGRTIAGWGKVGSSKGDSAILLKATIYEKTSRMCKKKFENSRFKWNSDTLLCAGAIEDGSGKKPDSCQGDSGGPLMARVRELPCSHVVVGVVSWGPTCGVGQPGIYTNAGYVKYLEWIASTVWPDSVK